MEIVVTLIIVFIVWKIIKFIFGTIIRTSQLYHALKDIRITTFKNQEIISQIFNIDFAEDEQEVKRMISIIIIASLKDAGYQVDLIPGNYKLSLALAEAVEDIYQVVEERKDYIDV